MAKTATRMATYTRDRTLTKDKYAGLHELIRTATQSAMSAIVVERPQTLGDDYAELVANLDAIAAADLMLVIVPPKHRATR